MEFASEGPLLYILENLSVPLRLHDAAGRVVYQNAAHMQILGDCEGRFCHQMLRHAGERCRPCTLDTEGECVGEELLADALVSAQDEHVDDAQQQADQQQGVGRGNGMSLGPA